MPATPDSFYRWGNTEELNGGNLSKRFIDLSNRIRPLESLDAAYQKLVGQIKDTVLTATQASVDNLRVQLQTIVNLNWVNAISGTSIALTQDTWNTTASLVIAPSGKDLFSAGPYSLLQSNAHPLSYAVLQTQSYDRTTGLYVFTILAINGPDVTYADWSVSPLAGATAAQISILTGSMAQQTIIHTAVVAANADQTASDAAVVSAVASAASAGGYVGVDPSTGKFATSKVALGASVKDPGTGVLETALPIQAVTTGASKAYVAVDLFKETRRSNSGAAMTDTFPASTASGMVNGTRIVTRNADTTASITITAGSGTQIDGAASFVLGPARSITWAYDSTVSPPNWRPTANGVSALLASDNLSGLASPAVALANLGGVSTSALQAALGNSSTDLRYLYLKVASLLGIQLGMQNGIVDPLNNLADINTSASSQYTFDNYKNWVAPTISNTSYYEVSSYEAASNGAAIGTNLSGYPAPPAFSGDLGGNPFVTSQSGAAVVGISFLAYDCGVPMPISRIVYRTDANGYSVSSALIQWSDDQSTWTTAVTATLDVTPYASTEILIPTNVGSHRYWRLLANSAPNGGGYWYVGFVSLQISLPIGTTVSAAKYAISANDYAAGNPRGNAFDGLNSVWLGNSSPGSTYIGQDFGVGQSFAVTSIIYTPNGNGQNAQAANLQISDDMVNWTTVTTLSLPNVFGRSPLIFNVPPGTGAHRGWRLLQAGIVYGSGAQWYVYEIAMRVDGWILCPSTPAGAISSGAIGGLPASYAFDGNSDPNNWQATAVPAAGANAWIGQDFGAGNAYSVTSVIYDLSYNGYSHGPSSVAVQYSDNGTSWTTAATFSVSANISTIPVPASGAHRYWRIASNSTAPSGDWYVTEITFYGPSIAMTQIAPKTAISGGDYSFHKAAGAFDTNTTRPLWISSQSSGAALGVAYVGQDFGTPVAPSFIAYTAGTTSSPSSVGASVTSMLLQYSDNMSSWTTAATFALPLTYSTLLFPVPVAAGAHRGWRILANSTPTNYWAVAELSFYKAASFGNLTLQSTNLPSGLSTVTNARLFVLVDGSSAPLTPNTDLVASFSRDGGATFTPGTLTLIETQPDGSTLYDTGSFSAAAQPAGNSMTYRLVTANAKNVAVTAVGMQAG